MYALAGESPQTIRALMHFATLEEEELRDYEERADDVLIRMAAGELWLTTGPRPLWDDPQPWVTLRSLKILGEAIVEIAAGGDWEEEMSTGPEMPDLANNDWGDE